MARNLFYFFYFIFYFVGCMCLYTFCFFLYGALCPRSYHYLSFIHFVDSLLKHQSVTVKAKFHVFRALARKV